MGRCQDEEGGVLYILGKLHYGLSGKESIILCVDISDVLFYLGGENRTLFLCRAWNKYITSELYRNMYIIFMATKFHIDTFSIVSLMLYS